jgi:hypothetical protein
MGGRENAFLKAKKKVENVGLRVLFSLFCTNVLFHFCSSLKKKLLPMRRCRRNKTSAKKKMPEMMMLVTTYFSWS